MNRLFSFILLVPATLLFCANSNTYDYNFDSPQNRLPLHKSLREISDIEYLTTPYLAAIQDEKGILYILNYLTTTIEKKIRFAENGDFEDIAYDGTNIYILRSDGAIFKISSWNSKKISSKQINSPIGDYLDAEGLAYDTTTRSLLIACKTNIKKKKKNKRLIYQFTLEDNKFHKQPFIEIKNSKKMMPSALAIHPLSKRLIILSAQNHRLYEVSFKGKIKRKWSLPKKLFPQAEGVTFSPTGTIFISSEGKPGTITYYKVE